MTILIQQILVSYILALAVQHQAAGIYCKIPAIFKIQMYKPIRLNAVVIIDNNTFIYLP